eukprot:m.105733 g.105733  ORF g.105733 m.105733 type:complete len:276 (+) comp15735_c0_seq1:318-1145(+)
MMGDTDERPVFPVCLEGVPGITGLEVNGFTHQMFNGQYIFTGDEVDDMPVFRRRQRYKNTELYIYHDPYPHPRWVLNDRVHPGDAVYCGTLSDDLHAGWMTTVHFETVSSITATHIVDPAGFNGEALRITGCAEAALEVGHCKDGRRVTKNSITKHQDGVYLRQGPGDATEQQTGRPHYVMNTGSTVGWPALHVWHYDPQLVRTGPRGGSSYWVVCPATHLHNGQLAQAVGDDVTRADWKIKSPDKQETRVVITLVHFTTPVPGNLNDLVGLPPK